MPSGNYMAYEIGSGIADTDPLNYQSSFLHPAFTLTGDRTGEDLIASNVLAFDIKAYDPSVQLLALPGPDGGPGQFDFDDDGDFRPHDDNPRRVWMGRNR